MKDRALYEKKKHGTPSFPLQYYYVDKYYSQYVMPPHWHNEFEIIRVSGGTLRLHINNAEYLLESGDIAFVGCGALHRGEPTGAVYECCVFDLNMLLRRTEDIISPFILTLISGEKSVAALQNGQSSEISDAVVSLFGVLKEKSEYYELAVYSALFRIFSELYRLGQIENSFISKRTNHRSDVITELLKYVENNYKEQITLKQLSYISGLNEKYICRLFSEYTNRTPIDYINNLRIENACREMTVNRKTVTEAAFESGFNDLSYFSRTFKKYKGTTAKRFLNEKYK